MRIYELVVVQKPSLTDAQRKKILDMVKSLLKDMKVSIEDLGQKQLAYPIKHENSGHYSMLTVEAESATITSDFEKRLMQEEGILRHLVIRKK